MPVDGSVASRRGRAASGSMRPLRLPPHPATAAAVTMIRPLVSTRRDLRSRRPWSKPACASSAATMPAAIANETFLLGRGLGGQDDGAGDGEGNGEGRWHPRDDPPRRYEPGDQACDERYGEIRDE